MDERDGRVQSSANRERDFTYGKASHFILLGVFATVLLVAMLAGLVMLITRLAGGLRFDQGRSPPTRALRR